MYDIKTLPYMLEECLGFHSLVDRRYTFERIRRGNFNQDKNSREIIHILCFGPLGYSKLCSQIPDHIVADRRFELILKSMTVFKAPKGSNDFGVYYLKDEYLDDVTLTIAITPPTLKMKQ